MEMGEMAPVRISDIASYIPDNFESNYEKKEKFAIDDSFITDKIGVERVSRLLPGQTTSDMCVEAFNALKAKTGLAVDTVDCIVLCTQNPDGRGMPHTSSVVQAKIAAPEECAVFDISLGCSGYVYGLSVVKSFMEANGLETGLFFTADPYSRDIDPADKDTALLFGDAATVSLLSSAPPHARAWTPVKFAFGSRGKDGAALTNGSGRIFMNGRAIFNFAATVVPVQIRNLLQSVGLAADDIDMFFFHQGSKYIVDTLRKRLNLPEEKVALLLKEHGNTISSSIPLLLEKHWHDDNRRVILSGFGVGLSWASCLLERGQ
jgi:3-oxoacyl-[acyl-carrier-protein] synthase-3